MPKALEDESRNHLLLVEDDPVLRLFLGNALTASGYRVTPARDGREAVAAIGCQPFDLLVSDIVLPVGDGIEVIARFRQSHPSSRIVAMTGTGSADDHKDMAFLVKRAGGDTLLLKPFGALTLIDKLAELSQVAARETAERIAPC